MPEKIEYHAIVLFDTNGDILNWNKGAEMLYGYEAKEITGKNIRSLYFPNAIPDKLIIDALSAGIAQYEGWVRRKNGSKFWSLIILTTLYNDKNEFTGFLKIVHNITTKLLADEKEQHYIDELKTKNKELEQFVYIACHDLQAPLRTITSFSDLLRIACKDKLDEEGKMYTNVIYNTVQRMNDLIKGVLDYSALDRRTATDEVDCNLLIKNIVSDLQVIIAETGTQIHYKTLPTVTGYAIKLMQLFQNLITNAIKFRKKEAAPEITINAIQKEDKWIFSIKDNGIGIDPKYYEEVFYIFKRLHTQDECPGNADA